MSTAKLSASVDALSSRILAIEALLAALADTCLDRAALRQAFDQYAAGIEARMTELPVAEGQLELLRNSLDDIRVAIRLRAEDRQAH